MIQANEIGHLKILDYSDCGGDDENVLLIDIGEGFYRCLWLESGDITPRQTGGRRTGWYADRIVKDRAIRGIKEGPETASDFEVLMMIYPKSAKHLLELRDGASKE